MVYCLNGARGKFGEHVRSSRVAWGDSLLVSRFVSVCRRSFFFFVLGLPVLSCPFSLSFSLSFASFPPFSSRHFLIGITCSSQSANFATFLPLFSRTFYLYFWLFFSTSLPIFSSHVFRFSRCCYIIADFLVPFLDLFLIGPGFVFAIFLLYTLFFLSCFFAAPLNAASLVEVELIIWFYQLGW